MASASCASPDEELPDVPISALEHYAYCPRQCALIHLEQTFDENLYTIRGSRAHERVVSGKTSVEDGVRVLRSLPLYSERYGLRGKADVVELHGSSPVPVEYKLGHGRLGAAQIQLCAQGLCLEEMYGAAIPEGFIFIVSSKQRVRVPLSSMLRDKTLAVIVQVRRQLGRQVLPEAPNDQRCANCSLIHSCLPGVVAGVRRMAGLQSGLFRPAAVGPPDA